MAKKAAKKKAAKVVRPLRSVYVAYDDHGMLTGAAHKSAKEARDEAEQGFPASIVVVKRYTLTEISTPGGK